MTTHTTSPRTTIAVTQGVCVWLIFGGVFGVLPLLVRGLELGIRGGPFSWQMFLGDGELLISSSAIAGSAMGELLFAAPVWRSKRERFSRGIAGGMTVITCVGSSAAYVLAKSTQPAANVVPYSLGLFACTLLFAGTCVALAVEE